MPGDTAMSFDWIFFAIVAPWPVLALWAAFVPRGEITPTNRRTNDPVR